MKLALYQGPSPAGDVEAAFARMEALISAASAAGARMLLLPELFLPGYGQSPFAQAQPLDGPWMARIAGMARAAGCGVTLGWAEAAEGAVFNAASAIGPDGALLAHYRKIQLYGDMERGCFRPGNAPPPIFDLDGVRAGLLICYDIEFPQHAADLARRGASLLLVPTANPAGFDHVPRMLVPARAHENRLIVAYANLCGSEGGLDYGGGSVVVGPDAVPLATAGRAEALLICDLPQDWPGAVLSTQDRDLRRI
ncbi:carbon-nitrogen hydrolase family protein [Falsirhodobacter xinxiangensis]|uniref:carbon-nitrogen hydrolase family protein n=1 Tax=Falsirhodobacter xinxiangensis TaxID=2530049 RepID=UPI001C701708|nr:carbon-nitrogen hydrolase family protein [Rhodobacter xinxiangensis]